MDSSIPTNTTIYDEQGPRSGGRISLSKCCPQINDASDGAVSGPNFLAGTPLTVLWRARSLQDEEFDNSTHTPTSTSVSSAAEPSDTPTRETKTTTASYQDTGDVGDKMASIEAATGDAGARVIPETSEEVSSESQEESEGKRCPASENPWSPSRDHHEDSGDDGHDQDEHDEPGHKTELKSCCSAPACRLDWSFVEKGRLYDCKREIRTLEQAFQRRLDQSQEEARRPSLILISGLSGTGKSVLAKAALQPLVAQRNGYYLYGKFDSLQRPEPYTPFVHAVTDFVYRILEQHPLPSRPPRQQRQQNQRMTSEESLEFESQQQNKPQPSLSFVEQLRREIEGAISVEGCSLLTSIIPALSHILGTYQGADGRATNASSITVLDPSQDRLKVTFRRFLRAICKPTRPLVLVLDDLQWADASSLDLLECLVCDVQNNGLVLVGVCRSNEVTQEHKLASLLRRLEDEQNVCIDSIVTKNLSYRATNQLVSDVLKQPANICEPLTDTIHWKTKGNVYYIINYIKALHVDQILIPDVDCGTGGWLWDEERWNELYCPSGGDNVHSSGTVEDPTQGENHVNEVVNLISRQLRRLPEDTQLLLRISSCLGADIDLNLLSKVLVDQDLPKAVRAAVDEGLVVPQGREQPRQAPLRLRHRPTAMSLPPSKDNYYMFAHDVVQQAAYSLISDSRKSAVHLSIGRMLFKNMCSMEEFQDHIYVVVNQMSRGMTNIDDQLEKDGLAALCLKAGNRAILSGDFHTAVQYFVLGTTLLSQSENYWTRQYELSLELYNSLAEAEYCVADFDMMDAALAEVFRNGRSFRDTIRAFATEVYALGARFMLQEAIDVGLKILDRFGETFPSSRPSEASSLHVLSEPMKIRRQLYWKSKTQLLDLPDMNHPDKVAAMGILNLLTTYSLIGRPTLFPFIAARLVKLSLSYGLCAISAPGFAFYGVWLCSIGDVKNGYRYGKLSLDILDRYQSTITNYIPRVYSVVYGLISHWRENLKSTLEPTLHAHRIGLETGDIEYAMYGAHVFSMNAFMAGVRLTELEGKMKQFVDLMNVYKQGPWAAATSVQLQMIHNLMGKSQNPLILRGEIMTDDKVREVATVKDMESYESYFLQVMVWRLFLAYHFGNIELAISISNESRKAIKGLGCSLVTMQCFYDGLTALAALAHPRYRKEKKLHLSVAKKALKKLKMLGKYCPENCQNKIYLLEAEFAATRGEVDTAVMLYNTSISLAQEEGFLQEEALAHERAGKTLQSTLSGRKYLVYLNGALDRYQEWGAFAKVDHMQRTFQMPPHR